MDFKRYAFTSLWCAYAAVASVIILAYFVFLAIQVLTRRGQRKAHTCPSAKAFCHSDFPEIPYGF